MMNFRVVTAALIKVLGDSALGRFTVTGYQGQGLAASQVRGAKRNAQVYYQAGDFPRSSGRAYYGSSDHHLNLTIGLTVSAAAACNLDVLAAAQSTAQQRSDALSAMQAAEYNADMLMDEFIELVYQIVMDGRNIDLGLPVGSVSDRWIDNVKKGDPLPQGTLVTLTADVTFSCRTVEDVIGDTPVLMADGVTVDLLMPGDDVQRTGVTVKFDPNTITYDDGSFVDYDDGTSITWG